MASFKIFFFVFDFMKFEYGMVRYGGLFCFVLEFIFSVFELPGSVF